MSGPVQSVEGETREDDAYDIVALVPMELGQDELMGYLAGKDVLVGAIDVADERVETPDQVAATIRAALAFIFVTAVLDIVAMGIIIPVLPGLIMELGRMSIDRAAIWAGAEVVRTFDPEKLADCIADRDQEAGLGGAFEEEPAYHRHRSRQRVSGADVREGRVRDVRGHRRVEREAQVADALEVRDTLAAPGPWRMNGDRARRWLGFLNDVRLVFGTRLAVTEDHYLVVGVIAVTRMSLPSLRLARLFM